MLNTVRSYIEKENLLAPNAKIIVGLSGGMDSMALIEILMQLNYTCIAAHCNFHLRGIESDNDEKFVKQWCLSKKIPFITTDFFTVKYAAQKKISIEMAARELRYNWFETIRQQYDADYISVAHHKDDSIETVLLNLIRGTGIKGLTGISPKNGYIIRPLLSISRSDIEKYIIENEIPYVTDSTNEENIYTRNMLRLSIMPILKEINPAIKDALYRTSQNLFEAEKIYRNSINDSIKKVYKNGVIEINKLKKETSPQSILFEILSTLGFTPSTIEDVYESMDKISGKTFYSESHRLIKDREKFLIDDLSENYSESESYLIDNDVNELTMPLNLIIEKVKSPVELQKNSSFLYADLDKLTFPLHLRKWKSGDWFIPFGMKGKKKLSDYFTDQKFSIKDKEDAWLLLSGNEIVWIVGERSDERFKITNATENILIIKNVDKES